MNLQFLFRKPKFPVIFDIDGELIVATSMNDFDKKIKNFKLKEKHLYAAIDSTVEGWSLSSDPLVISPLTLKKKWTKKELINLYNQSQNCKCNNNPYSESSLSNKKLSVIFKEIAEILKSP
jgi:hypothetical protein